MAVMQAQQPAPAAVAPVEFWERSKLKRLKLNLKTPGFVEGGTSSWQLPQAGLANTIWVQIKIPVTIAGTVTAGKFAGSSNSGTSSPISYNPAPYSVINRLRFSNTSTYYMRDFDGFHWYSWLTDRYGFDPMACGTNQYYREDVLNNVLGTNSQSTQTIKPGLNVAAQTYQLIINMPVPLSYNQAGDRGLLVLGTENLFYNLDIVWGTIATGMTATGGSSDLIKGLTGTGLSVTVGTPVITVELDYFMIPPDFRGRMGKYTDVYMSCTQNVQAINSTGLQTYLLPPNDTYTIVGVHFWNNGAPIPALSVTNCVWNYGGQVYDFIDDLACLQGRQAWLSQACPLAGKLLYDMGATLDLFTKRDTYSQFNDKTVTGLQIQANIDSGVTLSSGQMTIIQESLKDFRQAA